MRIQHTMYLSQLFPNPDQPRKAFCPKRLGELARSIKENGLLEPIVVVRRKGKYMIVAGERRYKACKLAGLKKAPIRIIKANARKVAELALLENLQREDLNLIEEARAYQNLIDMDLNMEDIARKMGFKQIWRVRERMDLLRLHPIYQGYLVDRVITPSQAYELSRLPHDKQHILFGKIKEGRADSYNKLRSLANALLVPPAEQTDFFARPSGDEISIGKKYDAMIDRLVRFICRSFDKEDLSILQKVSRSTVSVNIDKIDMIINYLQKIKKAMIQAQSSLEVMTH